MKFAVIFLLACCCFVVLILASKSRRKTDYKQTTSELEGERGMKQVYNKNALRKTNTKNNRNSNIKRKRRRQKGRKSNSKNKKRTSGMRKQNINGKKKKKILNKKSGSYRKHKKNNKKRRKNKTKKKIRSQDKKTAEMTSKNRRRNRKNKPRGKKGKSRNKKNKNGRKGNPISIKDIYTYTKGKVQNNHILEYSFTPANATASGIIFPVLNFNNFVPKEIIIYKHINASTTLQTEIQPLSEQGSILVTWSFDFRRGYFDSGSGVGHPYIFKRCYDRRKDCVAPIEKGKFDDILNPRSNCLRDAFPGAPAKILESHDHTKHGVPCQYWNTTGQLYGGRYVMEYGNRCITRPNWGQDSTSQPRCFAEDQLQDCFKFCNQDDLELALLDEYNTEIHVLLENNTAYSLTYQSSNGTVHVTEKDSVSNSTHDQAFYRCYNTDKKCVATNDGTCLHEIYDEYFTEIIFTILTNANRTMTHKPCVSWVGTFYGEQVQNPGHNLCLKPANLSCNSAYGPWCVTQEGWEPCFQPCNDFHLYILIPRFTNFRNIFVQEIIVTGSIACRRRDSENQKVTFLIRNKERFTEDADDGCGFGYTGRDGKFTFKIACHNLYENFENSAIQINNCCYWPTVCYRFTKDARVEQKAFTADFLVNFGRIVLDKYYYS